MRTSAIAEVYPAIWRHGFTRADRDPDQHDAYCIAAWLLSADRRGNLSGFLEPGLVGSQCEVAQIEGWILGVV